MGFNCGIIGLPNVGKSTIFNALTSAQAAAANYPFCTIEPNIGIVALPDTRLTTLAELANSAKVVPTAVEFVDIAGLVRGASKGEGKGNEFLGHIRGVDALVHVVRCFEDDNVTHVHGRVAPQEDIEVIDTELMLADLSMVEKRLERVAKTARLGEKSAQAELVLLERAQDSLGRGIPIRAIIGDYPEMLTMSLVSAKPMLLLANVSEDSVTQEPHPHAPGLLGSLVTYADTQGYEVVVISGVIESEISQLGMEERNAFLADLGLASSGLDRLAIAGYRLLNLQTFFTVGPKEARAWTCRISDTAFDAAGKIHSDFKRGFIRAEVIAYADYLACRGEVGARERGLLRTEGKSYLMQDGDVVHFRFNV